MKTPASTLTRRGKALLCAFALLPGLILRAQSTTPPTTANKTPDDQKDQVIQMEALSVTGSNIKRMDIEKVLPITIMSHDAIDARGALTPADLLLSLPQVTNLPLNETTQGSAGARGDVAAVNLRGIGASNSLVLLNGRRLPAHPTSGALNYAANVNQLPTQGIAQIEVLRDSASSVYGSDAVAGVVNYIMRRDYRGAEVKTRFGAPEHGEGRSVQTTLTFGTDFANGRGRFLMVADYLYRDAIYLRDRDYTQSANHSAEAPPPFNVNGSAFDGSAQVGNYPTFLVGTSTATNYFRPINGVMTLTTVAPTRAANPDYFVNLNQYFIGSPRTDRENWFSSLEYDLNNQITAFSDISFYHAESTTQRQPISTTAPTVDMLSPISIDSPYNPYGSHFYDVNGAPNPDGSPRLTGAPRAITLASEFIKDLPADKTIVDSNTYRVVAGLKGKFGRTWTWESGAMFGRSNVTDHSPFYVRESLMQKALLRTDSTAFNPFGYTFKVSGGAVVADQVYVNPHSVMDGFVTRFRRDGLSELASIDARASGQLYSLWSGAISLAVGAEYRREQFSDLRPPYISMNPPNSGLDPNDNDVLQFPPAPDSSGHRTVGSVYAETVIPITEPVNRIPLFRSLEVTGSARFEKYSDFGNTTKPKIGVNWKPFTDVMLRASYSEGFTAPSLPLLYAPAQYNTSGGSGTIDPYRNPVTSEGGYATRTVSSGNRQLKAADSTGKSTGIVLDVPLVKGLSVSADYWEISRNGVFGSRSATEILNTDATLLRAATAAQLAAGKTISQVDLGSGTANYKGDPAVIRYAVTPDDVTSFSKSTTAGVVGRIFSVSTIYLNLSEDFASGWDLSGNYVSRVFAIGRFGFNSDWAYLKKSYSVASPPNATPVRTDRVNVGGASRWHGTSTLTWRLAKWTAGFSAYYIGSYAATGATTTSAVYDSLGHPSYLIKQFTAGAYSFYYKIHDNITYNSFLSYRFGPEAPRWLRASTIRGGVVNVFDTKPPLSTGQNGYDTSVYNNLLAGRTWTIDVTKPF